MTLLSVQIGALWNQSFSRHHCDYLFQLSPPSSSWLLWPPLPRSVSVMCRSQSIVNLALPDSFSAFLLGVLSVEIDSLGWGLAMLRNVRVFAEWAALLASSSSSSNIDPPAFSSLAPTRWHRNCSTSKEHYEIKRRNVLLTGLLRNAQLVPLTQYLHHPRLISCCLDKSLLITLKWVNYLKNRHFFPCNAAFCTNFVQLSPPKLTMKAITNWRGSLSCELLFCFLLSFSHGFNRKGNFLFFALWNINSVFLLFVTGEASFTTVMNSALYW